MASKLTPQQWDVISFSEQYWRENSFFPGFAEIAMETGLSVKEVEDVIFDSTTKRHLEIRGINWEIDRPQSESSAGDRRTGKIKRLSDIQLATVSTILNPADKRSVSAKLESLGVAAGTYAGWKKNKHFAEYMNSQGEALFGEYMPDMHNALIKSATSGDVRSIKFAYEVSGRYRPNQGDDLINVQAVIIKLVEIIQKHVKDPLTLQNIAKEVKTIQGELVNNDDNSQIRSVSAPGQ